MRTAHFLIAGALGLGLIGTNVHAAPGSLTASARQQPKTSLEVLIQAEGLAGKISSQLFDNLALQSNALASRDTLKLACVQNQVMASRALVEASERTITSLRASIQSGQDVQAAPLYSVLMTLNDKSDTAHRVAAECRSNRDVAQKQSGTPLPLPGRAAPGGNGGGGGFGGAGLDGSVPRDQKVLVRAAPSSP